MKLSLLTDNLQKKLLLINHAISTKSQLPILSHVLLETKEGNISVSATDLEIGIETTIPAEISEEGSTAVPAKLFSELINNLPQEKISLEIHNGSLTITSKKTKSVLQTMKRDEFPALFEEKGEEIFKLKPEVLQKDFHTIVFAASMETTRPALSGVYMKQTDQGFVFVATDGYRLSLKTVNPADSSAFVPLSGTTADKHEQPLLVPARVVREALSLKEEGDISLFVSGQNNQVLFSQDNTILVGRLIEAEFPNYQKIIPTDASSRISFDREELQKAVKTCAIFARESANIIKFAIKQDSIIVSAKSPSVGENTVEVEASLKGEENEIAFNGKYLLDVLANINEENLIFEMTGPLNPGVFKIENDPTFLHLIMPIRTQV